MRDAFQSKVFVRPLGVSGVPFSGGGGRVDRRRSGVSKVRRHGHGAVIAHGQTTKKRRGRSNIRQRGKHLPLGAGGDLGDGGFAAAVREGAEKTGPRSVSPRAASPGAPVARALLPLAAVSPASSPVSPTVDRDVWKTTCSFFCCSCCKHLGWYSGTPERASTSHSSSSRSTESFMNHNYRETWAVWVLSLRRPTTTQHNDC